MNRGIHMNILFYLLNVVCSSGQSALSKQSAMKGGSSAIFNISKAAAGVLMFVLFGLFTGLTFHLPSCLMGIAYGAFLCLSMHCGFKALGMGPMAMSSIIASFSLIIPFLFGITVWGESLTVPGGVGIVLLLASIFLLNFKKEKGISFLWSVYAFLIMGANGICSLVQKYHQLYFPGQYRTELMVSALLTVLVILLVIELSHKERTQPIRVNGLGILSGLLNGASNYIVLYLAATEKASVLFPVVSVAHVIAVWLIGRVLYKERMKPLQLFGLLFGLAAILLLNLQK